MADLTGGVGAHAFRRFKDMGDDTFAELMVVKSLDDYPFGATPLSASSGNVANASAVATLAAAAGKFTYLTGFQVTGGGATAASLIDVTVTGCAGGTLTFTFAVPAGATAGATPMNLQFPKPLKSSAANTAIVVTAPAFGAGNTKAAANAHGYQL